MHHTACLSMGMMAVVELDDGLGGAPHHRACDGAWPVRPPAGAVRLPLAPLTTTEAELAEMIDIFKTAARQTPA